MEHYIYLTHKIWHFLIEQSVLLADTHSLKCVATCLVFAFPLSSISGLKVGHTCWPIWPTEPQNNPDVTHIASYDPCTYDPHAKVFLHDIEWCHRFLHSWQATWPVSCKHRLLEDENLWTPHASKWLEIISWFHTNDILVHSIGPQFTHIPDANTVF